MLYDTPRQRREYGDKVVDILNYLVHGEKKHTCSACGYPTPEKYWDKINALCAECSNDLWWDRADTGEFD